MENKNYFPNFNSFYINEKVFIGTNITLSTFSIVFVVSDITIPCGAL